ncbi:MAG TPA: MBL fold metallo-hydrolase [Pyrinomonadaceae bacterium]|jgi:glyoxylase-like metal-dependent hydrolase (beta-lactamase superfamily II)
MRRFVSTLAALALAAAQAAAHGGGGAARGHGHRDPQNDFSKVEIKTTKVAGSVYMLEGAGGNIGVSAGPDGVLIVDDQFAPLADKIRAALKPLSPGQLRFVLNTHFHFDHTHANPVFGREALIVAHANVRRRLSIETRVLGETYKPLPKEGLPVVTYETAVSVHFNGEEVRAVHFPAGHTDGDSVIYFTGSNVIHMGDDFFAGRFPFLDVDNGGSVEGLARNVAEIISKAPAGVKIIPGHGPLSTLEDLRAYHSMLVETTDIVRARLRAGRTLEQAKAEGLPDRWKEWGTGFVKTDQWVEIVYRSLQKNAGRTAAFRAEPAPRDAALRLSLAGERWLDFRLRG